MSIGLQCFNVILSVASGLGGLAGLIMMHVVRFKDYGRMCAGDKTADDYPGNEKDFNNLGATGKYLLGYLIFFWIICGCCILILCGLVFTGKLRR